MLIGRLQGVVVAVGVGSLVGCIATETREGNVILRVYARWKDLGGRIVVSKVVQMAAEGAHVADLNGVMAGELILHSEIDRLDIRGLEIVLASVHIQTHSAVDGRISQINGSEGIFHYRGLSVGQKQGMLRIGAIERRSINKRIVGAKSSAIAEIPQSAIGNAISSADHQVVFNAIGKSYSGSEIGLLSFAEAKSGNAIECDIAGNQEGVKRRGTGHLAALVRHIVGASITVAAGWYEVSLPAVNFSIGREIVPAEAEVQSQPWGELPVILEINSGVP